MLALDDMPIQCMWLPAEVDGLVFKDCSLCARLFNRRVGLLLIRDGSDPVLHACFACSFLVCLVCLVVVAKVIVPTYFCVRRGHGSGDILPKYTFESQGTSRAIYYIIIVDIVLSGHHLIATSRR
ncbi:hypothetical protein FA95DRAFT_347947 [Auriscalpium vulgare]|uniref:Uncharacterized protein n=1 Tax=Auriscalpium vulgare TaxID=40419 RepID=A0ACB8RJJ7_9AGAM|nr:hypothetical protein FA95DRAFT_347947 [Auriscalpium vulgare]